MHILTQGNPECLRSHLPLFLYPSSKSDKDEDLLEENRAIDPLSEEGIEFQARMETIFSRLALAREETGDTTSKTLSKRHLGRAVELAEEKIQFLLSDTSQVGASIYVKEGLGGKPTIVVTKGLLSVLDSEDQLAWVIGHEATHLAIRDALPVGKGSQGEEVIADLSSLYALYRAHYDPREALEALKILRCQERDHGLIGNLFQSFDLHGRTLHRISAAELALTKLSREEGGIDRSKTPLETSGGFKSAVHVSFVTRYLNKAQYATCDVEGKLTILLELIPHVANRRRASDLLENFRELAHSSPFLPAAEKLCDLLLDRWSELPEGPYGEEGSTSMYVASLNALWQRPYNKFPIGWMRGWATAIRRFKESKDPNTAIENASKVLEIAEERLGLLSPITREERSIFSPFFGKRSREQELCETLQEVEWPRLTGQEKERLLTWARVDPSRNIREALHQMGLLDDRFFNLYSTQQLLELNPSPLMDRDSFDEYRAKHLKARNAGKADLAYLSDLVERDGGRISREDLEEIIAILKTNEVSGGGLDLTKLLRIRFTDRGARDTLERFGTAIIGSAYLDKNQKLSILSGTCYHDLILDDILKRHSRGVPFADIHDHRLNELKILVGYQSPRTDGEVNIVLDELGVLGSRLSNAGCFLSDLKKMLAGVEVLQYLSKEEREFLSFNTIMKAAKLEAGTGLLKNGWREHLTLEMFRQIEDDSPFDILIRLYKTFEAAGWFSPDAGNEKLLFDLVLQRIDKLPSTHRGEAILKALAGERVRDPDLRKGLINSWVELQAKKLGNDTGDTAYGAKVEEAMRGISETYLEIPYQGRVNKYDQLELKKTLSMRLVAQRGLALRLEPDTKINAEDLKLSQMFGSCGQALVTLLEADERLNKDFIIFLSEPLTDSSISIFQESIESVRRRSRVYSSYLEQRGIFDRVNYTSLRDLHRNFWGEPLSHRIAILTPLLKNAKDDGYLFTEMLNRVFSGDAPIARKFVRAYIDISPEYERFALLAALMAATEKRADGRPLRVGEGLRALAENLGDPAFVKVCQAIHSNPTTPADIRSDLSTMKSMANAPLRRELFALLDLRLPEDIKGSISSVGRVIGAGSYWIIAEATLKGGEKVALGLLRDKAEARAREGFSRLERTLNRFMELGGSLEQSVAHAGLIAIRQARGMIENETNTLSGSQQVLRAHTLYDGVSMRADNRSFRTLTAPWKSWGVGYKVMKMAEGIVFNAIEDSELKRSVAKAYLTVELANLMSGTPFDHDRHGDQLLVDERSGTLWIVDSGAMRLEPYSGKDKEYIGNFLFRVYEGLQHSHDLASVAVDAMDGNSGSDGPPKVIAEVQRALLALADFYRELNRDDLRDVIKAALRINRTDPIVQQAFIDGFVDRYGFLGVVGALVTNAGPSFSTVRIMERRLEH